jgi:hypothetical protein
MNDTVDDREGRKDESPRPVRRPYRPPSVVKLGTLRDLTRALNAQGTGDGKLGQNKSSH